MGEWAPSRSGMPEWTTHRMKVVASYSILWVSHPSFPQCVNNYDSTEGDHGNRNDEAEDNGPCCFYRYKNMEMYRYVIRIIIFLTIWGKKISDSNQIESWIKLIRELVNQNRIDCRNQWRYPAIALSADYRRLEEIKKWASLQLIQC